MTPPSPSLAKGLTQQFSATGHYSDGSTKDLSSSVTWVSSSTAIATISSTGLVSAVAQGSTTITAASGSITGSATLSVTAPVLVSIQVTPASPSMPKGTSQQLTATGTYSDASQMILTQVTWSSSSTTVASVSSTGLVSALATGTSTITASSGSLSGTSGVIVTPATLASITIVPNDPSFAAGLTQQLTATGTYTDGSSQPLASLTWSTSSSYLATVDANGLVSSFHQGSAVITAASGSISGSDTLQITAPALVSIAVSPASASVSIGSAPASQQFTATGSFSDQSTEDISTQVQWTASNSYVAGIATGGLASAKRIGYSAITASLDGVFSSSSLTVLAQLRFLYEATDSGRNVARLTANAATGYLTHWGYQSTGVTDNESSACIFTDPANRYVYVANVGQDLSTGVDTTTISGFFLDPVTGNLASLGAPYSLSASIGCPQFLPDGDFAYATAAVEEATQQLVTLAKSSSGTLSVVNTTALPDYSGGLAIDPLGQFLYVATYQVATNAKASAYGFSIDSTTGNLTPVQGTPFALPVNTNANFAFNPSGDYLYQSDLNGSSIVGYSVNRTTGTLTSGAASIAPCINPTTLTFSPSGTFAFVGCGQSNSHSQTTGNLVSLAVGTSGSLTQVGLASAYLSPTALTVDPSGSYLYLISSGSHFVKSSSGSYTGGYQSVVTYAINPDGTTTEISETAGRAQEQSLLLIGAASAAKFADDWFYMTDGFPGDSIDPASSQVKCYPLNPIYQTEESIQALQGAFSISALPWGSDILTASQQSAPNLQAFYFQSPTTLLGTGQSFGSGTASGGVVIDPSGKLAFSTEPATGNVYASQSSGTPGQWSSIQNGPTSYVFQAESGAGPLTLDPSGRYLFVANQVSNSISEFEYAGAAAHPAFALKDRPNAITVDPSGNVLFVAGNDNVLHMLVIDAAGSLSYVANVSLKGTPVMLTVEPSGHYIYIAENNGVEGFAIDQIKQTLTALSINLPYVLSQTTGIYSDPAGSNLFIVTPIFPQSSYGFGDFYEVPFASDGSINQASAGSILILNGDNSAAFFGHLQ